MVVDVASPASIVVTEYEAAGMTAIAFTLGLSLTCQNSIVKTPLTGKSVMALV
jgi:hypothetical protein